MRYRAIGREMMSLIGKTTVILAVSGLAVMALGSPVPASAATGWQVFATIAPNNEEVQLNAVTAIGRGDAWAVGPTGASTGDIVVHWNGTHWRKAAVPAGVLAKVSVLSSVAATSDSNIWASHFNGSTWRTMSLPGPAGQFGVFDASAVSANDIWAVVDGGPGKPTANGLVRWNGRRWRSVAMPSFLAQKTNLASVLALPGGQVWVAGGIPHSAGH